MTALDVTRPVLDLFTWLLDRPLLMVFGFFVAGAVLVLDTRVCRRLTTKLLTYLASLVTGRRHILYRHHSARGKLLYIGITSDLARRNAQHAESKHWWGQVARTTTEAYWSRASLERAEIEAIRVEDPVYNIAHKRVRR